MSLRFRSEVQAVSRCASLKPPSRVLGNPMASLWHEMMGVAFMIARRAVNRGIVCGYQRRYGVSTPAHEAQLARLRVCTR